MNPYETETLLREYLLFHYGAPDEVLPWAEGPRGALGFASRVVREGLARLGEPAMATSRALDLGCAVGGSSFELARTFGEVLGVDFSSAFAGAAQHLADHGELAYAYPEVGAILRPAVARVPTGVDRSRVRFTTGDAMAPDPAWGTFDLVLAANLLCRLPDPRRCLTALGALVRPGGGLIISSPQTWLEAWTPRAHWLGATPETGSPREALVAALANDFRLVGESDVPFVIREHARKFQWSVADLTVWRRRA